ncbi:undecaprenyl/decaprenyl-phosphate alpha-N-acetylglucosaminyl 1-phosphate transferase [Virgibacillus sp. MSP4-1]|uniref:glycosyltransferase family 4 protein n=1 Tax=Virgibacillus sp. MSP4-1 TaxID=2700081 RepID=UPI0003A850C5|nr:MraY family glycosyltransferase [Virgibacillus sp. MSP4-1]QHS23530.1 undecaprenyl/decaprenyl-phosphate alpha-N-acetylglucosaminyl 1-phosphate transferase [Virgibacillus sp. MSP4-1]
MFNVSELVIAFFISFFASLTLTLPVKKFAEKVGAVDVPNQRKIHEKITPRMGGLSIYLGAVLGLLYIFPIHPQLEAIAIGSLIIVITGMIDDKYTLKPLIKLLAQITSAGILIAAGVIIDKITLPFLGVVYLDLFSIPVTLIWIVGITNAINLIDGLDGLASGVSTIALTSILVLAIIDYRLLAVYFCIVLIGSNLGFLVHNFYPAKIYMGDTGSLFLGYSIAVISILGLLKNVALLSFIIPILVLAVPIFDTLFAIIRRLYNKENIMMPDKKHIHYQLIEAGLSHRATVLIIYGFSAVFGILAILFSEGSVATPYIVGFFLLFFLHILAESAGLVGKGKKPVINFLCKKLKKEKNYLHKRDKVEQEP